MLKKLLKYDLIYINKVLIVFYLLAIFFALLTRMFLGIDDSTIMSIIGKVCSGIMISMIINIIINNLMRVWSRFVNNLYGDESYLTHTLPIPKKTIYTSKAISSVITMFISTLVIGICLFIAYYSKENIELLKGILLPFANIYNSTVLKLLLTFLAVFFLQMIFLLVCGYTGIILGHRKNNNRIVLSIIYGFVIYFLLQAIMLLGIFVIGLFNSDIMNLFTTNSVSNMKMIKLIMYLGISFYTIFIIISYFVNVKLFNKGVNVY